MPLSLALPRSLMPGVALLASLGGCQCGADPSPTPPDPTPAAAASAAPEAPGVAMEPGAGEKPAREIVGASQILVAYKGAELAAPTVTRSKDEARRRAEEVLAQLQEGKASFEELARRYSDDVSKAAGGAMGNFERSALPPALADAAFTLVVGDTSGVIETGRGFHIVRRTR
jgi:hypothetical protein